MWGLNYPIGMEMIYNFISTWEESSDCLIFKGQIDTFFAAESFKNWEGLEGGKCTSYIHSFWITSIKCDIILSLYSDLIAYSGTQASCKGLFYF